MNEPGFLSIEAPPGGGAVSGREADEATRGSAIKLGAESAGRLLSLVTTLLVARSLGVAEFGVFAALSGAAVILAEAADLGLQATASRALVARTLPLRAMVRAKLILSALVGAAALGLLALSPLLAALVAYFTLAGWSEFLGVALRARGRRAQEAVTILCLRAAGLCGAALALGAGTGTLGLAQALAASTIVPVAIGALLLGRIESGPDGAPDPGFMGLLRTALPLGLNGGFALVSLRLEVLALGILRGASDAGLFASALRLVESLLLVPGSVSAGAMPALTREALRGSGPVRRRTATTVALLAVPAATGLVLVAPGLLQLLFGPAFAGAAAPLRLLALALVALFMNSVLLHALIAAERAAWLPRLTGARLALAAALALALVPPLGASGAALGFCASELALLVLASRACTAAGFGVPVARPLALGACASLPMAAAVALSRGGPLASVALGVLTYTATLAGAWRLAPRLLEPEADVRYS